MSLKPNFADFLYSPKASRISKLLADMIKK